MRRAGEFVLSSNHVTVLSKSQLGRMHKIGVWNCMGLKKLDGLICRWDHVFRVGDTVFSQRLRGARNPTGWGRMNGFTETVNVQQGQRRRFLCENCARMVNLL